MCDDDSDRMRAVRGDVVDNYRTIKNLSQRVDILESDMDRMRVKLARLEKLFDLHSQTEVMRRQRQKEGER